MVDKRGLMKNSAFHLALILVLVGVLVYVVNFMSANPYAFYGQDFADPYTVNYSLAIGSNGTINEDALYNFSILINATPGRMGMAMNITRINVTLPAEVVFQNNSNRTTGNLTPDANGAFTNLDINHVFNYSTDRKQLTWSNGTAGTAVIPGGNNTYNNSIIAFNFTVYTPGKYNISVQIFYNGTDPTLTSNKTNITIWVNDTTKPWNVNVTTDGQINASRKNNNVSGSATINLSAFDNGNHTYGAKGDDVKSVVVWVWNQTTTNMGVNASYVLSNVTGQYWNFTLSTTKFPDGNYTLEVRVNDTNGNVNKTTNISITIDNTAPTGSATCSPGTVNLGDTVSCSCSVTDPTSGENTSVTSITANPSTSSTGTFSQTCSFADLAGNSGTTTASYTVEQGGSSSGTGTTGTTGAGAAVETQTKTVVKVTPGTATVVKNFDVDTGVKEIQIEVNNEAQNVKITVNKYDEKPAEVTVEKTGKVNKYLQIELKNVEDKLAKAKLKLQVEKDWVANNSLAKEDLVISKFDENNSVWNELPTTYSEEDDTYYYYETEVTSFSYFAIGEKQKAAVPGEEEGVPEGGEEGGPLAKTNLLWLWIALIVIALGAVGWTAYAMMKKKK